MDARQIADGLWSFGQTVTLPNGDVDFQEEQRLIMPASVKTKAAALKLYREVTDPKPTMFDVRAERDRLLAESDWTQLADSPVDQVAWAAYRQALRDLPEAVADPAAVEWPAAPV